MMIGDVTICLFLDSYTDALLHKNIPKMLKEFKRMFLISGGPMKNVITSKG